MSITAQEGNSPGSWDPRQHSWWSPEVEGQQTQSGKLRKLAQLAPSVPLLGPWELMPNHGAAPTPRKRAAVVTFLWDTSPAFGKRGIGTQFSIKFLQVLSSESAVESRP